MVDLASLLKEIKVARLQSGDVILVKVKGQQEDGVLEYIRRRLEQAFPGHRVIILDGVDLEIVRPEKPEVCTYGHIRSWTSAACQVCGELMEDPDLIPDIPTAGT